MAEKRVVILDSGAPVAERLREVKVGDTTGIDVKLQAATGNEVAVNIQYETDKLTSGNDTGLVVNQTNTSSPGVSKALDIQQGTISKAYFNNNGQLWLDPAGAFGATTGIVFGDGDTAIRESADDALEIVTGGTIDIRVDSSGLQIGGLSSGPKLRRVDRGNTSAASFTFQDDTNTGVISMGLDMVGFVAGGVEGIRITEDTGAIVNDLTGVATLITGHTIAGLPTPATGMIARITDGDASLAWGATALNSGAGATPYMVFYNGTNWTIMGK